MGLGSAIVADGVETLWRSVSVLIVLGLHQGVVLAIVVMLNFCQDGSQNGMHWDKIQSSEGDHQHAYMCIWNREGDMRWYPHTFLLKMPPGQQNFLGSQVFRVMDSRDPVPFTASGLSMDSIVMEGGLQEPEGQK